MVGVIVDVLILRMGWGRVGELKSNYLRVCCVWLVGRGVVLVDVVVVQLVVVPRWALSLSCR